MSQKSKKRQVGFDSINQSTQRSLQIISSSCAQKQKVSICHVIHSNADIQIFDARVPGTRYQYSMSMMAKLFSETSFRPYCWAKPGSLWHARFASHTPQFSEWAWFRGSRRNKQLESKGRTIEKNPTLPRYPTFLFENVASFGNLPALSTVNPRDSISFISLSFKWHWNLITIDQGT